MSSVQTEPFVINVEELESLEAPGAAEFFAGMGFGVGVGAVAWGVGAAIAT